MMTTKDKNDEHQSQDDKSHESCESGIVEYFCILQDSGNSTHLDLSNDGNSAVADHSTPRGICMSKQACEVIVAAKFDVKYAKRKGACRNNPHVVHLNDAQVAELINK